MLNGHLIGKKNLICIYNKIWSQGTVWPCPGDYINAYDLCILLGNCLADHIEFCLEPLWVGGTSVCSRHLGHMTKMAATPIYG